MSIENLPLPYLLERSKKGPVSITGFTDRVLLSGKSNYDVPAQQFADKIAAMDDEAFVRETGQYIWLSAYAGNNPTSDYHWMASACYYEAQRRGSPDLYQQAYDDVAR
jgi:hypothetical protein